MLAQQTIASLPRRRRWLSLSVASLATLLVTADTGQLSIALPVIIGEFNADLTLASWIALGYALITASLYLPCGRLSDLVGIGKVFSAGFLLYAASALAAGWSQSAEQLILFRALQAAGSALIMANNFRAGDGFVSAGRAGAGHGYIGRNGVGAWLYIRSGARRITYLRLWVALKFVSIGDACVRWFGCCPLFAAAGKLQRLIGEKRAFRFSRHDHFRIEYLFAFACAGYGTKRQLAKPLSSPLSFSAELSFWFCLFGWNTVRAFHSWI
jgi:MFS family permease